MASGESMKKTRCNAVSRVAGHTDRPIHTTRIIRVNKQHPYYTGGWYAGYPPPNKTRPLGVSTTDTYYTRGEEVVPMTPAESRKETSLDAALRITGDIDRPTNKTRTIAVIRHHTTTRGGSTIDTTTQRVKYAS